MRAPHDKDQKALLRVAHVDAFMAGDFDEWARTYQELKKLVPPEIARQYAENGDGPKFAHWMRRKARIKL